jgi:integrase
MGKNASKKKNGKIFVSFLYPDGKRRKLYLRKISPDSNLYVWYYDSHGTRKRVTTGTDDVFEAKERLDSFDPISESFAEIEPIVKDTTSLPPAQDSTEISDSSLAQSEIPTETSRSLLWSEFFDQYHLPHYKSSHKKKTVATHLSANRMFLKHFGDRPLRSFDFRSKKERAKLQLEFEKYFQAVKERTSPWTARNYFACLRVMFERARGLDLIQNNLLKEGIIKQERPRNEHPYFLTAQQFQKIMSSFEDALDPQKNVYAKRKVKEINEAVRIRKAKQVAFVGFHTGARLNELIHLNWEDIDFENRMVQIKDKPEEGFTTKTASSRRKIPMTEALYEFLYDMRFKTVTISDGLPYYLDENDDKVFDPTRKIEHHEEVVPRDSIPYVFHVYKRRMRDEVASKIFKRIASRTEGIDPKLVHFHTLRHSFCTNLIRNGVPVAQVKTWAGHSRLETTLIYTHIMPSDNKEMIDKLML